MNKSKVLRWVKKGSVWPILVFWHSRVFDEDYLHNAESSPRLIFCRIPRKMFSLKLSV